MICQSQLQTLFKTLFKYLNLDINTQTNDIVVKTFIHNLNNSFHQMGTKHACHRLVLVNESATETYI